MSRQSQRNFVIGVAVAAALAGGVTTFALLRHDRPAAPAASAGHEAHDEEEADHDHDHEGLVELTAQQQQAARIGVVAVSRGGAGLPAGMNKIANGQH